MRESLNKARKRKKANLSTSPSVSKDPWPAAVGRAMKKVEAGRKVNNKTKKKDK